MLPFELYRKMFRRNPPMLKSVTKEPRAVVALNIRQWEAQLAMPRLAGYHLTLTDFPRIVANSRGSSMKTNPVELTDAEITRFLEERL